MQINIPPETLISALLSVILSIILQWVPFVSTRFNAWPTRQKTLFVFVVTTAIAVGVFLYANPVSTLATLDLEGWKTAIVSLFMNVVAALSASQIWHKEVQSPFVRALNTGNKFDGGAA